MLTKEVVVEYSTEYLKLNGYSINLDDKTSDLVAFKENEFLRVIALGNVSDAGGTNKKGRGFNKNQVRTNLALALFEVSRQITINEKVYEYVIDISKLDNKNANVLKWYSQGEWVKPGCTIMV